MIVPINNQVERSAIGVVCVEGADLDFLGAWRKRAVGNKGATAHPAHKPNIHRGKADEWGSLPLDGGNGFRVRQLIYCNSTHELPFARTPAPGFRSFWIKNTKPPVRSGRQVG
jgi:hypothetical protein